MESHTMMECMDKMTQLLDTFKLDSEYSLLKQWRTFTQSWSIRIIYKGSYIDKAFNQFETSFLSRFPPNALLGELLRHVNQYVKEWNRVQGV